MARTDMLKQKKISDPAVPAATQRVAQISPAAEALRRQREIFKQEQQTAATVGALPSLSTENTRRAADLGAMSSDQLRTQRNDLAAADAALAFLNQNGVSQKYTRDIAQGNRRELEKTQTALKQAAEQEKPRTTAERDSLLRQLEELNRYSGYAVTQETNDAYQQQRRAILDQIHAEDEALGNRPRSYDAQDRTERVIGGSLKSGAGDLVNSGVTLTDLTGKYQSGILTQEDAYVAQAMGMSLEEYAELKKESYNSQQARDDFNKAYAFGDRLSAEGAQDLTTAKEGVSELGRFGIDLTSNGIQMGMDALGRRAGLGMLPFFFRAAGGGAREARQDGATLEQQALYGTLKGTVEVGTEKLFDGLSGMFGKGAFDDVVEGAIRKLTKNDTARSFLRLFAGGMNEGAEEVLSDLAEPFLQTVYNDRALKEAWENRGELAEQMLYDFLLGAAMGTVGSAGSIATGQDAQKNAEARRRDAADFLESETLQNQQREALEDIRSATMTEHPLQNIEWIWETLHPKTQENGAGAQVQQEGITMPPAAQNAQGAASPGLQEAGSSMPNTEESIVTISAGPSAFREDSKGVANTLARNIGLIEDDVAVTELTGREMQDKGQKISDQILNFFNRIGGKVNRANFGEVILDKYGQSAIITHRPINRAKMVSLTAVPEVISEGKIISDVPNWKNRGYRSVIFAAPVNIAGERVYVAAVVNQLPGSNKFYLNECVDSEGNFVRIEEAFPHDTKSGIATNNVDTATQGKTSVNSISNPNGNVNNINGGERANPTSLVSVDNTGAFSPPSSSMPFGTGGEAVASPDNSITDQNRIVNALQAAYNTKIKVGREEYGIGDLSDYVEWLYDKYGEDTLDGVVSYLTGVQNWPYRGTRSLIGAAQAAGEISVDKKGRIKATPEYAASLYDEYIAWPAARAEAQKNTGDVQAADADASRVTSETKVAQSPSNSIPNQAGNANHGNLRERGVSSNVRTNENLDPVLRELLEAAPLMYEQKSNKDTLAKAQEIFDSGFEEASQTVTGALAAAKKGLKLSPEDVPLAYMVADEYARRGNFTESERIISDLAAELTYYGQVNQASIILRNQSPVCQTQAIQKLVDKLNRELTKGQKRANEKSGRSKTGEILLDQSLLNRYAQATDPELKNRLLDQIEQNIADQIPATFMEKFTAMRYMNMLSNLKTQGRNIVGNLASAALSKAKDAVKVGVEGLVSAATKGKYEKTASLYVNRALRKEALSDASGLLDELRGEGKYADTAHVANAGIQDKRTIFRQSKLSRGVNRAVNWGLEKAGANARINENVGLLEGRRQLTNWAMETGDAIFLRYIYADKLGGYLQANGCKSMSEASPALLDRARAYAIREAQEATFRDSNRISDWVSGIGRGPKTPKGIKVMSEGIAPFRKTPANVAIRAVEYSPLGLAETIYKGIQVKQGKATAADVINSASKTAVGTALFAAGVVLKMAGRARGSEDDDKLDQFQKMQGAQDYSITIGGVNVSLSQLAPSAVPFFMGVEFAKAIEDDGRLTLDDIPTVLGAVSGPLLEMSMLGGINDTLSDLGRYGNDSPALFRLFANAGISYLTQGLTSSFSGQIEQAGEEYRQTSYTDPESLIPQFLQYPLSKAMGKIPGRDYNQQDYINAWGRRQSNGGPAERSLNAFLNPLYYGTDRSTKVDAELERLYEAGKNLDGFPNVLPQRAARSLEYAEGKRMTPEEYQQYSIDRGQMSLKLVSDFMGSAEYRHLSDQQRAEVISDLYTMAADRAMKTVKEANGVEYTGDWDKAAGLSEPVEYLSYKQALSDAGKDTANSAMYESADSLLSQFNMLPRDVQNALKEDSGLHVRQLEFAAGKGISSAEWYDTYEAIKDARVATGSQAQAVTAAAVARAVSGNEAEKLEALEAQLPPENGTGKRQAIVRRYETAMSMGASFDQWTRFETALKDLNEDGGTPKKTEISQAAAKAGLNGDTVYLIYKKYYDDADYVTLYDESYAEGNPAAEKEAGISLTAYLDGYRGVGQGSGQSGQTQDRMDYLINGDRGYLDSITPKGTAGSGQGPDWSALDWLGEYLYGNK